MTLGKNAQHTVAAAAVTELVLMTFRTNGRLVRAGDKILKDLKLTTARWQVIASLEERPRTVAQIAREYELTRQGVLWVVQTMMTDELVELVHNPDHRRSKLVRLTERGSAAAELVNKRQRNWANATGESFEVSELKTALAVLQRLGEIALGKEPEDDS